MCTFITTTIFKQKKRRRSFFYEFTFVTTVGRQRQPKVKTPSVISTSIDFPLKEVLLTPVYCVERLYQLKISEEYGEIRRKHLFKGKNRIVH